MNINWIDPALNPAHAGNQLNSENKQDSSDTANSLCLVFENREHLDQLCNAIADFDFSNMALNLRFGIIEMQGEKGKSSSTFSTEDQQVVYFGTEKSEKNFLNIAGENAVMISNQCHKNHRTIAFQRHLSQENHIQSVSLGEFKADFGKAESLLRASDMIFLDLNVIRRQDSFYPVSKLTGLDIYEASQLLRYCGLSARHSLLHIKTDFSSISHQSWECMACLLWYYIEGCGHVSTDDLSSNDNHVYMVENVFFNDALKFIKSNITNRWWFVHPETGQEIPCSEQDYISVREGAVPDLILDLCVD